jgi:hypothetical protein
MYERMLDKQSSPTEAQIQKHMGKVSFERFIKMEEYLKTDICLPKS